MYHYISDAKRIVSVVELHDFIKKIFHNFASVLTVKIALNLNLYEPFIMIKNNK